MSNPISLVEFVCIGNNGRSPFGEAFARQFLVKYPQVTYSAISSGIKVDASAKKEMTDADYLNYVRIAHERGILVETGEIVDKALKEDKIDERCRIPQIMLANKYVEFFRNEEAQHRDKVAMELGLVQFMPHRRTQTTARPDVKYVFVMTPSLVNSIEQIYLRSSHVMPTITTLSQFALGNEEPIQNTFATGNLALYRANVKRIGELTEKAMYKVLDGKL